MTIATYQALTAINGAVLMVILGSCGRPPESGAGFTSATPSMASFIGQPGQVALAFRSQQPSTTVASSRLPKTAKPVAPRSIAKSAAQTADSSLLIGRPDPFAPADNRLDTASALPPTLQSGVPMVPGMISPPVVGYPSAFPMPVMPPPPVMVPRPVAASSQGATSPASPTASVAAVPVSYARTLQVLGVANVGSSMSVIVAVPGEDTPRTVSVGDRLFNGAVLVKRVNANGSREPIVILEENGQDITRTVGSAAIPAQSGR